MKFKSSRVAARVLSAFAAICVVSELLYSSVFAASAPPIKVMGFNIRYGAAKDGTNSWEYRKDLVVQTINVFNPDLLGMQEVLDYQGEYIQKQLPDYYFYGVGREDGKKKGEFAPVVFKKERFKLINQGHFWLSETPEVVGSKSWDSSLSRICTWVLLEDKLAKKRIIFANTHLDHIGKIARQESAILIRKYFKDMEQKYPIILTGDFNTTEDTVPYKLITEPVDGKRWFDSFRVIHPVRTTNEVSFNGWKNVRVGSRIDWILHSPEFVTINAMIDYTCDEGRLPSDHFPVEAVLRYRK